MRAIHTGRLRKGESDAYRVLQLQMGVPRARVTKEYRILLKAIQRFVKGYLGQTFGGPRYVVITQLEATKPRDGEFHELMRHVLCARVEDEIAITQQDADSRQQRGHFGVAKVQQSRQTFTHHVLFYGTSLQKDRKH